MKKKNGLLAFVTGLVLTATSMFGVASFAVADTTKDIALWTVSDSVEVDEAITLTGYQIYESDSVVKARSYTDDTVYTLTITDGDTAEGSYMTAMLPSYAPAGVYDIWVKNSHGTSDTLVLNGPRVNWATDDTIYAGVTVYITGRNFDANEYGLTGVEPVVRLVSTTDSDTTYSATIIDAESNAYKLAITVDSSVPVGEYYVEVSMGDYDVWSRADNDQTLTVVDKTSVTSSDNFLNYAPAINVTWLQNINWETVINFAEYTGVQVGEATDVTDALAKGSANATALKAILNTLKTSGGVLYFPDGDYVIDTNIVMYSNMAVVGESQNGVRIHLVNGYYDPSNPTPGDDYEYDDHYNHYQRRVEVDNSKAISNFGLYNLTIDSLGVDNGVLTYDGAVPDMFIMFNSTYGLSNAFLANITVNSAWQLYHSNCKNANYRGIAFDLASSDSANPVYDGYYYNGGHVYVSGCNFSGLYGAINRAYTRAYFTMVDTTWSYLAGAMSTYTAYSYICGNTIDGNSETLDSLSGNSLHSHGFFHRSYAYYEGNNIYDTYDNSNSGEAICAEICESYSYGKVISATSNTITVTVNGGPVEGINVKQGRLAVRITTGKGAGQSISVDPTDIVLNGTTATITLLEPWDIIPDATSYYSLQEGAEQITYYNNTVVGSTKGLLMYCNYDDAVAVGNTLKNSAGIGLFAVRVDHSDLSTHSRYNSNSRIRIEDNDISGISPITYVCGIRFRSEQTTTGDCNSMIQNTGIEVRNNTITAGGYWGTSDGEFVNSSTADSAYTWIASTYSAGNYERQNLSADEVSFNVTGATTQVSGIAMGMTAGIQDANIVNRNILIQGNTVTGAIAGVFVGHSVKDVVILDNNFSGCTYDIDIDNRTSTKSATATYDNTKSIKYYAEDTAIRYRYNGTSANAVEDTTVTNSSTSTVVLTVEFPEAVATSGLISTDATTGQAWYNTYGSDGYIVFGGNGLYTDMYIDKDDNECNNAYNNLTYGWLNAYSDSGKTDTLRFKDTSAISRFGISIMSYQMNNHSTRNLRTLFIPGTSTPTLARVHNSGGSNFYQQLLFTKRDNSLEYVTVYFADNYLDNVVSESNPLDISLLNTAVIGQITWAQISPYYESNLVATTRLTSHSRYVTFAVSAAGDYTILLGSDTDGVSTNKIKPMAGGLFFDKEIPYTETDAPSLAMINDADNVSINTTNKNVGWVGRYGADGYMTVTTKSVTRYFTQSQLESAGYACTVSGSNLNVGPYSGSTGNRVSYTSTGKTGTVAYMGDTSYTEDANGETIYSRTYTQAVYSDLFNDVDSDGITSLMGFNLQNGTGYLETHNGYKSTALIKNIHENTNTWNSSGMYVPTTSTGGKSTSARNIGNPGGWSGFSFTTTEDNLYITAFVTYCDTKANIRTALFSGVTLNAFDNLDQSWKYNCYNTSGASNSNYLLSAGDLVCEQSTPATNGIFVTYLIPKAGTYFIGACSFDPSTNVQGRTSMSGLFVDRYSSGLPSMVEYAYTDSNIDSTEVGNLNAVSTYTYSAEAISVPNATYTTGATFLGWSVNGADPVTDYSIPAGNTDKLSLEPKFSYGDFYYGASYSTIGSKWEGTYGNDGYMIAATAGSATITRYYTLEGIKAVADYIGVDRPTADASTITLYNRIGNKFTQVGLGTVTSEGATTYTADDTSSTYIYSRSVPGRSAYSDLFNDADTSNHNLVQLNGHGAFMNQYNTGMLDSVGGYKSDALITNIYTNANTWNVSTSNYTPLAPDSDTIYANTQVRPNGNNQNGTVIYVGYSFYANVTDQPIYVTVYAMDYSDTYKHYLSLWSGISCIGQPNNGSNGGNLYTDTWLTNTMKGTCVAKKELIANGGYYTFKIDVAGQYFIGLGCKTADDSDFKNNNIPAIFVDTVAPTTTLYTYNLGNATTATLTSAPTTYSESTQSLVAPVYDKAEFLGWSIDGTNAVDSDYVIPADNCEPITFTALWDWNTTTITYTQASGVDDALVDSSSNALTERVITYATAYALDIPVRTNYTFGGWNTTAYGILATTGTWTHEDTTLTLVAVWEPLYEVVDYVGKTVDDTLTNTSANNTTNYDWAYSYGADGYILFGKEQTATAVGTLDTTKVTDTTKQTMNVYAPVIYSDLFQDSAYTTGKFADSTIESTKGKSNMIYVDYMEGNYTPGSYQINSMYTLAMAQEAGYYEAMETTYPNHASTLSVYSITSANGYDPRALSRSSTMTAVAKYINSIRGTNKSYTPYMDGGFLTTSPIDAIGITAQTARNSTQTYERSLILGDYSDYTQGNVHSSKDQAYTQYKLSFSIPSGKASGDKPLYITVHTNMNYGCATTVSLFDSWLTTNYATSDSLDNAVVTVDTSGMGYVTFKITKSGIYTVTAQYTADDNNTNSKKEINIDGIFFDYTNPTTTTAKTAEVVSVTPYDSVGGAWYGNYGDDGYFLPTVVDDTPALYLSDTAGNTNERVAKVSLSNSSSGWLGRINLVDGYSDNANIKYIYSNTNAWNIESNIDNLMYTGTTALARWQGNNENYYPLGVGFYLDTDTDAYITIYTTTANTLADSQKVATVTLGEGVIKNNQNIDIFNSGTYKDPIKYATATTTAGYSGNYTTFHVSRGGWYVVGIKNNSNKNSRILGVFVDYEAPTREVSLDLDDNLTASVTGFDGESNVDISVTDNVFKVTPGAYSQLDVTITANAGYKLDTITLNGTSQQLNANNPATTTLTIDSLKTTMGEYEIVATSDIREYVDAISISNNHTYLNNKVTFKASLELAPNNVIGDLTAYGIVVNGVKYPANNYSTTTETYSVTIDKGDTSVFTAQAYYTTATGDTLSDDTYVTELSSTMQMAKHTVNTGSSNVTAGNYNIKDGDGNTVKTVKAVILELSFGEILVDGATLVKAGINVKVGSNATTGMVISNDRFSVGSSNNFRLTLYNLDQFAYNTIIKIQLISIVTIDDVNYKQLSDVYEFKITNTSNGVTAEYYDTISTARCVQC